MFVTIVRVQNILTQILTNRSTQLISEDVELAIFLGIFYMRTNWFTININNDRVRDCRFLRGFFPNRIQRNRTHSVFISSRSFFFQVAYKLRGVGLDFLSRSGFSRSPALKDIVLAANHLCKFRRIRCYKRTIFIQASYRINRTATPRVKNYVVLIDYFCRIDYNTPVFKCFSINSFVGIDCEFFFICNIVERFI